MSVRAFPLFSFELENGAGHFERRIRFNHPNAYLGETLFGAFLGMEDRRLRHPHVSRGLGSRLSGLLAVALGQCRKIFFGIQLSFRHTRSLAECMQFSYALLLHFSAVFTYEVVL